MFEQKGTCAGCGKEEKDNPRLLFCDTCLRLDELEADIRRLERDKKNKWFLG